MKAELKYRVRMPLSETAFVEMVVWFLPKPLRGSSHSFKYRLALVADGTCVMRYDNETAKGDHKHIGDQEVPYEFADLDRLLEDFWADVESWRVGG
jgi:hypothetical protein